MCLDRLNAREITEIATETAGIIDLGNEADIGDRRALPKTDNKPTLLVVEECAHVSLPWAGRWPAARAPW